MNQSNCAVYTDPFELRKWCSRYWQNYFLYIQLTLQLVKYSFPILQFIEQHNINWILPWLIKKKVSLRLKRKLVQFSQKLFFLCLSRSIKRSHYIIDLILFLFSVYGIVCHLRIYPDNNGSEKIKVLLLGVLHPII